jgi:hypothetical protein
LVAKSTTADSNTAYFGFGNSALASASSGYWGNISTLAGRWVAGLRNSANANLAVESAADNNTNANVYEWFHTGAAVSLRLNGAAADPNAQAQDAATVSPNRVAIACVPRLVPATLHVGQIGEILVYNANLSVNLRTQIRYYLSRKWGVSVLLTSGAAAARRAYDKKRNVRGIPPWQINRVDQRAPRDYHV